MDIKDIYRLVRIKLFGRIKRYIFGNSYVKIFKRGKNIIIYLDGEMIFSGQKIKKRYAKKIEETLIEKKASKSKFYKKG